MRQDVTCFGKTAFNLAVEQGMRAWWKRLRAVQGFLVARKLHVLIRTKTVPCSSFSQTLFDDPQAAGRILYQPPPDHSDPTNSEFVMIQASYSLAGLERFRRGWRQQPYAESFTSTLYLLAPTTCPVSVYTLLNMASLEWVETIKFDYSMRMPSSFESDPTKKIA